VLHARASSPVLPALRRTPPQPELPADGTGTYFP
jgi:hypothetical protein